MSCILTTPLGDSRTAGWGDLAPTWLITSKSTGNLEKADPLIAVTTHPYDCVYELWVQGKMLEVLEYLGPWL